jgi:hypothetical protein
VAKPLAIATPNGTQITTPGTNPSNRTPRNIHRAKVTKVLRAKSRSQGDGGRAGDIRKGERGEDKQTKYAGSIQPERLKAGPTAIQPSTIEIGRTQ